MISLKLSVRDPIFTTMKIYRSTNSATLYSGAPIFSGALAADYNDSTALFNVIYYYGVDFCTAGGDYVRLDIGPQTAKTSYGPGLSLLFGNAAFAHMDFIPASTADVPSWTGFFTAYQTAVLNGTTGLTVNNGNVATIKFMYNGEIYYFPSSLGLYANPGNAAFMTTVLKVDDNLAGIASYDINGYKYKPEVMKKSMLDAGAWGYITPSASFANTNETEIRPGGANTYTSPYPTVIDDSGTRKAQAVNTGPGVAHPGLVDTNGSTTYIAMVFKLLQS